MQTVLESSDDLVAALGFLCLGTRLKRLGERMQAGVSAQLAARGLDVQPAQLPLLWALRSDGPLTIGALGERLGISQPGVSRAIAALEAHGLVTPAAAGRDRRQRQIAISPAGEALMASLADRFFQSVNAAVEALCNAAGTDFLGELARIEAGLAAAPMEDRIAGALRERADG